MKKFVRIRTRNSTSRSLRRAILVDNWAVCRLGSLTSTEDCFETPKRGVIEVNTVDAIQNSRSKIRMKSCFTTKSVPQADAWYSTDQLNHSENFSFPVVVKRVFGFQGRGMKLINNQQEFDIWLREHPHWSSNGWFIERYYNYAREYRLHVGTKVGVFLSWRKLRRRDATERWFFNSENCEWYGTEHAMFDQPKCWKAMCKAAVDALKSTGLDLGAVDIRVQSNTQNDPKFIVCEINSAPALGEVGVEMYKDVIKKIVEYKTKYGKYNM
jgi:glutathione synthase/RimK-type ligase-like ATP-grasp enzyme